MDIVCYLMLGAFNICPQKLNINQINLDVMAETGGSKILAIITICIIALSILLSGCIEYGNDKKNGNDKNQKTPPSDNSYYYCVYINVTPNSTYELIVPVMITPVMAENTGNLSIIMNNLIVSGNANYEIVNTQFGNGLKIKGSNNISIKSEANESVPNAKLNFLYDSNNDGYVSDEYGDVKYWIYINLTNISNVIYLEVFGSVSHGSATISSFFQIESIKDKGWIIIDGNFVISVE